MLSSHAGDTFINIFSSDLPHALPGLVGEFWWQSHDCKTQVTITFVFTTEASETGNTTEDK